MAIGQAQEDTGLPGVYETISPVPTSTGFVY